MGRPGDPIGQVLRINLQGALIGVVLPYFGVDVSDDLRAQIWAESYEQVGLPYGMWEDPQTRQFVAAWMNVQVAVELLDMGGLDYDTLVAAMAEVPVVVAPRYGSWDTSELHLTSRVNSRSEGPLGERVRFQMPA